MNIRDALMLKHVIMCMSAAGHIAYQYDVNIDLFNGREYMPMCITRNSANDKFILNDYRVNLRTMLNSGVHICSQRIINNYIDFDEHWTKIYDISTLSLKQIQKIIDENIALFNQLKVRVTEEKLINRINEL